MMEAMNALDADGMWELVIIGRKAIWCQWIFIVKVNSYSSVGRLKSRIVIKGYAQNCGGVDYSDTLSPIATLKSIHLYISGKGLRDFEIFIGSWGDRRVSNYTYLFPWMVGLLRKREVRHYAVFRTLFVFSLCLYCIGDLFIFV